MISASGSSVLTVISLIGCFSTTVWSLILSIFGAVVSFSGSTSGLEFGSFGSVPASFSSSSVNPSPSSSLSWTSGIPSPSVSLWTVILNSVVSSLPALSLAVTLTSNSLTSSSPQSATSGVPEIVFVSLSKVTPAGRSATEISASGSFVVTFTSLIGLPSTINWSPILSILGAVLSSSSPGVGVVSFTVTGTSTVSFDPSG